MFTEIEKMCKKNGRPSFAFLADVHWRGSTPLCRTDDFVAAQVKKMSFVTELCNKYDLKLFIAGDFYDKARPSISTIVNSIEYLPWKVEIIPGQHDLPNHDIGSMDKSGLSIISKFADVIPNPFQEMYLTKHKGIKIGMYHGLVFYKTVPWKGFDGISSHSLKREFPDRDIIVCGDNHQPFIDDAGDGPVVVNCGSVMRTTAAQKDHRPCMYFFFENGSVGKIYLPIEQDVISDEHIAKRKKEEADFNSFVEGMTVSSESLGLDFKNNARDIIHRNKIAKTVEDEFWKTIGEAENE